MVRETRVQRKKRRRRLFIRIMVFLLVVFALVLWSLKTSFFSIKTILIEGNSILKEETIVKDSKIELGENIIKASKKDIQEEVEKNSYVKTVKISKKLPSKIKIEVEERKPYMQVEYNYSFAILDREGVLLEYSKEKMPSVTLIKDFKFNYIEKGEDIFLENKTTLPEDFFKDEELDIIVSKLKDIVYDGEDNIKINLYDGIVVEFGPLIDVKYKLRMLDEIIEDIESKNIKASKIIMNKGEYPIVVRDEK